MNPIMAIRAVLTGEKQTREEQTKRRGKDFKTLHVYHCWVNQRRLNYMKGCTCRHAQYPCYISGMMLCFLSVSLDLRWPLWGHSACVCTHTYSSWHKPCFTIWLGSWVCLCVSMLWRAVVCLCSSLSNIQNKAFRIPIYLTVFKR